jgi:Glyoxalase-like domain
VQVTFDAADPAALAAFWAQALPGYQLQPPPPGFESWDAFLEANGVPEERRNDASAIVGDGPRLFFQRVPEPKSSKNRVHLDLQSGGGPSVPLDEQRARVAKEVERLTALGATVVEEHAELGVAWTVMTDPEGNEFCA